MLKPLWSAVYQKNCHPVCCDTRIWAAPRLIWKIHSQTRQQQRDEEIVGVLQQDCSKLGFWAEISVDASISGPFPVWLSPSFPAGHFTTQFRLKRILSRMRKDLKLVLINIISSWTLISSLQTFIRTVDCVWGADTVKPLIYFVFVISPSASTHSLLNVMTRPYAPIVMTCTCSAPFVAYVALA